MISASKYHGYGNSFLVVPAGQAREREYSRLASEMSSVQTGVGADGCVFLEESSRAEARLRIFNRDGSEAAMSGNGARCAAAFLRHRGGVEKEHVRLETLSGERTFRLLSEGSGVWEYSSEMGEPQFEPGRIPFLAEGLREVTEFPLEVAGERLRVEVLSVGNPQCVVLVEELPESPIFERLGKGLETHPRFPERTNVSFVRVAGPGDLRIRIWERGVGPTCSSGTGACGAAVAALRRRLVQPPVRVSTQTGTQVVRWSPGGVITLTGEARFVADVQFHWSRGE